MVVVVVVLVLVLVVVVVVVLLRPHVHVVVRPVGRRASCAAQQLLEHRVDERLEGRRRDRVALERILHRGFLTWQALQEECEAAVRAAIVGVARDDGRGQLGEVVVRDRRQPVGRRPQRVEAGLALDQVDRVPTARVGHRDRHDAGRVAGEPGKAQALVQDGLKRRPGRGEVDRHVLAPQRLGLRRRLGVAEGPVALLVAKEEELARRRFLERVEQIRLARPLGRLEERGRLLEVEELQHLLSALVDDRLGHEAKLAGGGPRQEAPRRVVDPLAGEDADDARRQRVAAAVRAEKELDEILAQRVALHVVAHVGGDVGGAAAAEEHAVAKARLFFHPETARVDAGGGGRREHEARREHDAAAGDEGHARLLDAGRRDRLRRFRRGEESGALGHHVAEKAGGDVGELDRDGQRVHLVRRAAARVGGGDAAMRLEARPRRAAVAAQRRLSSGIRLEAPGHLALGRVHLVDDGAIARLGRVQRPSLAGRAHVDIEDRRDRLLEADAEAAGARLLALEVVACAELQHVGRQRVGVLLRDYERVGVPGAQREHVLVADAKRHRVPRGAVAGDAELHPRQPEPVGVAETEVIEGVLQKFAELRVDAVPHGPVLDLKLRRFGKLAAIGAKLGALARLLGQVPHVEGIVVALRGQQLGVERVVVVDRGGDACERVGGRGRVRVGHRAMRGTWRLLAFGATTPQRGCRRFREIASVL